MAMQDRQERLFNDIAAQWWDENGPMAPLHWMNPVRLSFIKKYASSLQGKKVLDVGCGAGLLSEPLARQGAKVTSIDTAEEAIHVARKRAQDQGLDISYHDGLLEESGISQKFDVICALEVIEHVENPQEFLKTLAQFLKPDGLVFLSTMNKTAFSYFAGIFMAEQVLKILPRGTHDWQKFFKPSELTHHMHAAGLVVEGINGMALNPVAKSFTLTREPKMNYILVGRKG